MLSKFVTIFKGNRRVWFSIFPIAAACFLLVGCLGESSEETTETKPDPEKSEKEELAPSNIVAPQVDMASVKPGEVYQKVCAACHGANGEGNKAIKSPRIAGLPKWYVKEQTGKFRSGLRGAHPEDTPGPNDEDHRPGPDT